MSRFRLVLARALLIGMMATGVIPSLSKAQDPERLDRVPEEVAAIGSKPDRTSPDAIVSSGPIRSQPRAKGTPSAGLKITLDGSASSGGRAWYRWLQTMGPKVVIDEPMKPVAHITVPPDASALGFVLVVGDASGVDARYVQVDIDDTERDAEDATLKADAGDDQAAKVGKRVVLNGIRSEPRGKIKYRWVQAGGPKVTLKTSDGPTTSFVPSMPGAYQFALIVATSRGAMSEPATVTINVTGAARASGDVVDGPTMAIDEFARVSLASIEGGNQYAEDLSRVFDLVADRIDTHKTYIDAATEISRRLDHVVPRDKDRRAVWVQRFFTPLMTKVAGGLRQEGIDITLPENQSKPLTTAQKSRLAEQFRYTAVGLRASRALR